MMLIRINFHIVIALLFCTPSFALMFGSVPFVEHTITTIDSIVISADLLKTETQDSIPPNATSTNVLLVQKSNTINYPPNPKSYRRLVYNTALYFGFASITFAVLYTLPEDATNWNTTKMKENGLFYEWGDNVKSGPVWDKDSWSMNYVIHPYCGALYYISARGSGFKPLESFVYTTLMSTFFWEFGIESFAETPSYQDLIVTPILGSAVGEGFFYAKKSILKNDKRILKSRFIGKTILFFIDPFNTILDGLKYKEKVKTQMNVAPVGFNYNSNKTVWGVQFSASF